ncbi:hypothetical protein ACWV26_14050 [Rummeliibacillus sp. JY-2-4R]
MKISGEVKIAKGWDLMTESSKPLANLKMQKNPVQDLKSDVK